MIGDTISAQSAQNWLNNVVYNWAFISCALLLFNAGGFVAFASDYFTSIGGYICLWCLE
jgi:hypothetical protein